MEYYTAKANSNYNAIWTTGINIRGHSILFVKRLPVDDNEDSACLLVSI